MLEEISMIISNVLIIYFIIGMISFIINIKHFLTILDNRHFRKNIWKIIITIESILLWPLTIKLSYKTIRNNILKLFFKVKIKEN